jgi:hypothetical protein
LRGLGEQTYPQDSAAEEQRAASDCHVSEYAADRKVVATSEQEMCLRCYILRKGAFGDRAMSQDASAVPIVYVTPSLG